MICIHTHIYIHNVELDVELDVVLEVQESLEQEKRASVTSCTLSLAHV